MSIIQGHAKSSGVQGFYPKTIDQSLRFEDGDSAYLTWMPATTGDRKKHTFSFWYKRGNIGISQRILSGDAGTNFFTFLEVVSDKLYWRTDADTAGTKMLLQTSQVLRDPSAWYHIVVVYDSAQATASDRAKMYVNGTQITAFDTATYPPLNQDSYWNIAGGGYGFDLGGAANYLDGYMAEVHFTDGTAYTADAFGELKSGIWVPKAPSVTYGTNGFYLPFGGGSDFSGYFDGTGDYLSFSSNVFDFGTSEDYSVEMFVKFNSVPSTIGFAGGYANSTFTLNYSSGNLTVGKHFVGTQLTAATTFNVGQWYHIVACRQSGTLSLFVDGTRLATGSDSTGYTAIAGNIGTDGFYAAVDGYISNARVLTGASAYDPTSASLTVPTSALTAITNTELLTCQNGTFVDNSTNSYTITANGNAVTAKVAPFNLDYTDDHSGEGNTWTFNNIVPSDVVPDSPTNNFAVFNPLHFKGTGSRTLLEGNLRNNTSTTGSVQTYGSLAMVSGKWYWEVYINSISSGSHFIGIAKQDSAYNSNQVSYRSDNGNKMIDGTETAYGTSYTTGQIIGVAYSADDDEITFYEDNVSQGTISLSGYGGVDVFPVIQDESGTAINCTANFGQDSTFAGNKTAGGNTDANGIGDFKYAPPSGYLALCTSNLPDPVIDPAQDATPEDYFNVALYTGDGTTGRGITGVGFSPDFVWTKGRSGARQHLLFDTIRGNGAYLLSTATNAEATDTNTLTTFDADGFTIGSNQNINTNTETYVSWNWKAGGTGVSNTDGSITSTVSANTDAGFSIVSFTANNTAGATVGHGLSQAPEMLIVKVRDAASGWPVYHSALGGTKYLALHSTIAAGTDSTYWNNTDPDASVFTLGTSVNYLTNNMIAYCFHSVDGFSKVGSYVGNGSTDGTFVYTGFRPKFIMLKRANSTGGSWIMMDAEREPYNFVENYVLANSTAAEVTTTSASDCDFLSNGIKFRTNAASVNASGDEIIYIAFAESPFKYSNAR